MFFTTGTTPSVTQAAGAPGGAVRARPNVVVEDVKTNRLTPAATASSSRLSVPVTFVATKSRRGWESTWGLWSVAAWMTASTPSIDRCTSARSATDPTTVVQRDGSTSRPTSSMPGTSPRTRISASRRWPELPVTSTRIRAVTPRAPCGPSRAGRASAAHARVAGPPVGPAGATEDALRQPGDAEQGQPDRGHCDREDADRDRHAQHDGGEDHGEQRRQRREPEPDDTDDEQPRTERDRGGLRPPARRDRRRDEARDRAPAEARDHRRAARQVAHEHRDVRDCGAGEQLVEALLELLGREAPVTAGVAQELRDALALGVGRTHRGGAWLHALPVWRKQGHGRKCQRVRKIERREAGARDAPAPRAVRNDERPTRTGPLRGSRPRPAWRPPRRPARARDRSPSRSRPPRRRRPRRPACRARAPAGRSRPPWPSPGRPRDRSSRPRRASTGSACRRGSRPPPRRPRGRAGSPARCRPCASRRP